MQSSVSNYPFAVFELLVSNNSDKVSCKGLKCLELG